MKITEHWPTVRRFGRGRSQETGRTAYGWKVTCGCDAFEHRHNGRKSGALDLWRGHVRSLTAGLAWIRFSNSGGFVCESPTNAGVRCGRPAMVGLRRELRSASDSVFCTAHARQYGAPDFVL